MISQKTYNRLYDERIVGALFEDIREALAYIDRIGDMKAGYPRVRWYLKEIEGTLCMCFYPDIKII